MRRRARTGKLPVGIILVAALILVGVAVAWVGLRSPVDSQVDPPEFPDEQNKVTETESDVPVMQ